MAVAPAGAGGITGEAMNCSNCGQANAADATTCVQCGAVQPVMPPAPPPSSSYAAPAYAAPSHAASGPPVPNHLVWAILATICCCLPTGIVAIIFAAQVDGKVAAGDLAGARQASDNAKLWSWISLGAGLFAIVGWVGLNFLGVLAGAGSY